MSMVLDSIRDLLTKNNIPFHESHHEATPTSADSARIRGVSLKIGGKALVLKIGDEFKLLVLSAERRLNTPALVARFNTKKTRFATADELIKLTGLIPGSVPPFGKPILPLDLYLDESITQNEMIAFNAGSLTDSIDMKVEDYLKVANPVEIFSFAIDRSVDVSVFGLIP